MTSHGAGIRDWDAVGWSCDLKFQDINQVAAIDSTASSAETTTSDDATSLPANTVPTTTITVPPTAGPTTVIDSTASSAKPIAPATTNPQASSKVACHSAAPPASFTAPTAVPDCATLLAEFSMSDTQWRFAAVFYIKTIVNNPRSTLQ